MGKRTNREVEAFKEIKDIEKIKQYLKGKDSLRDYTIFVVGLNVGLRAGDLLSLKWLDVLDSEYNVKSEMYILEGKTKKGKTVELNKATQKALQDFKNSIGSIDMDSYIFTSRKGDSHLQVRSLHRIIDTTAKELNIKGNYGTHSLRKSFGYHRYNSGIRLETLQEMFNHSTQEMTLKYIGITKEVIQDAYNSINL